MATCRTCGEEKPSEEFYPSRLNKDGLSGKCKLCCRSKNKEWTDANAERSRELNRAKAKRHYERNAEKIRARKKELRVASGYEADRAYYQKNKERISEVAKSYPSRQPEALAAKYLANKEEFSVKAKRRKEQWSSEKRAEVAAKRKAYQDANRDHIYEYDRQRYEQNKERISAQQKVYYENNRPLMRDLGRRRRARVRSQDCGCVPTKFEGLLVEVYGNACIYCGGPFEHVDHFVPIARGGKHCLGNLVPACAHCNSSKGGRLIKFWKKWNGATPTLTCPNISI